MFRLCLMTLQSCMPVLETIIMSYIIVKKYDYYEFS